MRNFLFLKSASFLFFMLLINHNLLAQNISSTKVRCGQSQVKKTSPKKTYKKIELPSDYKPPVADKNTYTFRETFATKKQLKRISKHRKRKAKGCAASKF